MQEKFFSVQEFWKYYEANKDILDSDPYCSIDIVIRKNNGERNGLCFQTGESITVDHDINIQAHIEEPHHIYLFGNVNFEGPDPSDDNNTLVALYRKTIYDIIMESSGSHNRDIAGPGKRGSPYGDNTPYITVNRELHGLPDYSFEKAFKRELLALEKFIRIIDSEECTAQLEKTAKMLTHDIAVLIDNYRSKQQSTRQQNMLPYE